MRIYRFALPSMLFLCLLFSPAIAMADTSDWLYEVRFGILHHDTDGLWSGNSEEEGIDVNAELVFAPSWSILAGYIRPNLGVSINTEGDTSKIYAGGVYEIEWQTGIFFNLAFGGAVHDGKLDTANPDRKDLGSRFQFRTGLELGYSFNQHHRISIMFDHISNADLATPNPGLDTLGLRYSYRF